MNNLNGNGPADHSATIAQQAMHKANATPNDIAIYLENGEHIRFKSIFDEAMRLAASLHDIGLRAGDVISFQIPNWRESVAIDIAANWLGLIVNPIVPVYRDRELRFILQDCHSKCMFIPEEFRGFNFATMLQEIKAELPELEHVVVLRGEDAPSAPGFVSYQSLVGNAPKEIPAMVEVDVNQTKIIMYTSGTTGHPKAVLHTHNSMAQAIGNGVEGWGLAADDVMLMPSPVTHVTGYANGIELPFISECRSAFMERWDVNLAVDYIEKINATVCVSATPFLQELVDTAEQKGLRLESLRAFACGGASVPPTLIEKARDVLANCRAFRVYGCTEAPLVTVGWRGDDELALAAHTDGRIHNWDVRIVDDEGVDVNPGADGEIIVKGPALMQGYGQKEQTTQAMNAEGYFCTGDIGHVTAEGAIVITDRKKDIIIRGGENISAREIEDILHQHPNISEASVVAIPHKRLGEGVCAVLVTRHGEQMSVEDLHPIMKESGLAKQKWPERVEVMEELPKTASGKVKKDILRAALKETSV